MSTGGSGLGVLRDPIESNYFSYAIFLHKYESFILESFPTYGRSSICMDFMYIWKGKNNNFFSNLDIDPRNNLNSAETESLLWAEAQASLTQGTDQHRPV